MSTSHVVVVAPLKPGTRDAAQALIASGPPFALVESELVGHHVHLTDREVVFVFEGVSARSAVEHLVGDPGVWRAAASWRECLAGRPRLAVEAFSWAREPAD